jgi:hypothetical protein
LLAEQKLKLGGCFPTITFGMSTINEEALNNARKLILRDLGDLKDIPVDLRNTVVNTYYQFCSFRLDFNRGPHYHPSGVRFPNHGWLGGLEKYYKESAHLEASVENLPQIINGMREMKKHGQMEGYKLSLSVALDLFKYRIPNAPNKSSIRLALERPFYAPKVREIPNLWKLL